MVVWFTLIVCVCVMITCTHIFSPKTTHNKNMYILERRWCNYDCDFLFWFFFVCLFVRSFVRNVSLGFHRVCYTRAHTFALPLLIWHFKFQVNNYYNTFSFTPFHNLHSFDVALGPLLPPRKKNANKYFSFLNWFTFFFIPF